VSTPARHDCLLLLALGAVATGLAAWLALGPLEGVAHVSDEVAYTLQAKLFAAGMRTGPPADQPSMLLYPFWQTTPRSSAVFPPGWPALLAVGVRLGAPWLVNAALAGTLPTLSWLLARAWERPLVEARTAALVAALSPGVVLLAGSRMAHTSVLVALATALVVAERRRDGPLPWLLGGVGLATVVLARPFDAALLGGPLIALGLVRGRQRAWSWVLLPGVAATLVLLDNHALTGSATTFPVGPWYDAWVADTGHPPGCNRLGFGADIGCHLTLGSWGHTPAKAAAIAADTLTQLDRHLLGLPGGLVLAAIGAARSRRLWVPAAALVLVVGGYALYWSPGQVFGARFYHPLYAVLPVLVAAAAGALPTRLRAWLPGLVLVVTAGIGLRRISVDLQTPYWCGDGAASALLDDALGAAGGGPEGVVLVRSRGERDVSWPWLGVDHFTCDPLLESGDLIQRTDPTRTSGGIQVRHAPPDAQVDAYLDRYHPGAAAWLLLHDVESDRQELRRLR